MTSDVTARIEALESRLRWLEDEREIRHLVTGYGPLVDAGAADEVAALWTEDGVYDVAEVDLVDVVHAVLGPERGDLVSGAGVDERAVAGHEVPDLPLVLEPPEPALERLDPGRHVAGHPISLSMVASASSCSQ